ncbi:MAG TPA: ribonuclease HII [Firmicutes bacterium]|nr:ribonuclease HII [Bacillota bacterium]
MKTIELFDFDRSITDGPIAGIDEAGRGPLAGPVVCACCIMPMDHMIEGVMDSKKISENKREKLYETIVKTALDYSVSVVENEEIDEINILNATKKGMHECILKLKIPPEVVLIDAVKIACDYKVMPIIKGDAKSYNIAAASIIAKVTRDRIMRRYDGIYPDYGFAKNKGYGTSEHIEAIKKYGLTQIHRRTFVKNFYHD